MYLYLAGDIGGYKTSASLAEGLPLDKLYIQQEDRLILLGDNVYPKGVPEPTDPDYPEMAGRLRRILGHLLENFHPPIHILPGNHDYNRGFKGGRASWESQKEMIGSFFAGKVLPTIEGQPQLLELGDVRVVLIDTQHFLQPDIRHRKRAMVKLKLDLSAVLQQCVGHLTIVCGHHPMYSRAMHGGKFSLRQHVFPLSFIRKRLYIPLPIIGSALPIMRRAIGAKEDMRHPRYRLLRRVLKEAFAPYEGLLYVAGHDHNLQHYLLNGNHFIVSGSASKTAYVRSGGRSDFVSRTIGCFRVKAEVQPRLEALTFTGDILARWPVSALKMRPTPA